MKKNTNYEINFTTNTIIVTKRFREAAAIIGTPEFNTMLELRKLNMPITERVITRTNREDRWTFKRMEHFIRNVDGAEQYMADYHTLRDAYGYMKVWAWFKKTFPNYASPELDRNHKIVVTPVDYLQDASAAA